MKRKRESPRSNFCFTFNNYTNLGEEALKTWLTENCKYAIFGHEIAPTTGTPHLQGYFSLTKQSRTTTIQKKLTNLGIDLALIYAKGNAKSNRDYCTKADPNSFFELGQIKAQDQGARNDLNEVVEFIKKDVKTIEELASTFPTQYIKFNRGLKDFKSIMDKKALSKERDVTVSVFYGEGGTGKTQYAISLCEKFGISYYILSSPDSNTVWWDFYDGEKALIIDDFYGWIKPHELFRICDRYKYKVPFKGGFFHAQWLYVFITSNQEPKHFYKDEVFKRLDETAYFRRLHNIYLWEYWDDEKTACCPLIKEKDERPIYQKMLDSFKSSGMNYESHEKSL